MKERKKSGATHSFRLTRAAADIVDDIQHPRRLGGKSRKVSEAIEWYFSPVDIKEEGKYRSSMAPSPDELVQNIAGLQSVIASLSKSDLPPPTWRGRLMRQIARWRSRSRDI